MKDCSIIRSELKHKYRVEGRQADLPAGQHQPRRLYQQDAGADKVRSQTAFRGTRWPSPGSRASPRTRELHPGTENPPPGLTRKYHRQINSVSAAKSQKDRSPQARRALRQPICIEGAYSSICRALYVSVPIHSVCSAPARRHLESPTRLPHDVKPFKLSKGVVTWMLFPSSPIQISRKRISNVSCKKQVFLRQETKRGRITDAERRRVI